MVRLHAGAGKAYGVLRCSDPRPRQALLSRFREALENIKLATDETGIPPETEFRVLGLPEEMRGIGLEDEAVPHVLAMIAKGANVMIRTLLPGAPNTIAARDLGDCINMLYGGTELFDAENGGRVKPLMDIFYRSESGAYVSKLELDAAATARDNK